MAAEPTKAMIANILDCWDAAERELGMNPDAGLELFQQFPRVGDLLEAVRTAALALCESPAAETPLCKDDAHLFGNCKTCGMPWLASRLQAPTVHDLRWAARSIHDEDVAATSGPRGIHVGAFETCDAPSCAAARIAPPTSGAAQETKS